LVSYLR